MFNVIYYLFFIVGTLLISIRIYFCIQIVSDISRIYRELKLLPLASQKLFLDSHFDLKFLDDRTYVSILNGGLKKFILQNIKNQKTKDYIVCLINAFRIELKYREATSKPVYKRVTSYCLYIGLACLISSWIIHVTL